MTLAHPLAADPATPAAAPVAGLPFAHVLRRPDPAWRLVCLAFASGAAGYFRPWHALLPDEAELWPVELPGRGVRFGDALQPDMHALVDALTPAVATLGDRPLVVFGHSMGSAIAFALTRRLQARGVAPALLVVSGRDAPHLVRRRDMHRRADADLRAEMIRLGGTPEEVLTNDGLMELILPILRNDYQLIETYDPGPDPVSSPILSLCGEDDADATDGGLAGWSDLTTGGAELARFPGGHFYLNQHAGAAIDMIAARLTPAMHV